MINYDMLVVTTTQTYLHRSLFGGFSLLLLVKLLDGLLDYVGPEVSLKVGDLRHTRDTIVCAVLEDVLGGKNELSN